MTKMVDETIRPEWIKEAKGNGISYSALRHRLLSADWDIEDAITIPSSQARNKYGEHIRKAKENGITRHAFYLRIRRGATPEQASQVRMNLRKHDHDPELYEICEQAIKNGINRGTFWNRIYRGMDPILASTTPARPKRREAE